MTRTVALALAFVPLLACAPAYRTELVSQARLLAAATQPAGPLQAELEVPARAADAYVLEYEVRLPRAMELAYEVRCPDGTRSGVLGETLNARWSTGATVLAGPEGQVRGPGEVASDAGEGCIRSHAALDGRRGERPGGLARGGP